MESASGLKLAYTEPLIVSIFLWLRWPFLRSTVLDHLMHADDLVLIADSETELTQKLNQWKDGKRVNTSKTKIIVVKQQLQSV